MTFSVMWTLLPDGYAPGGTGSLKLSLIASPRIADTRASLGNSPLLNWPTFAAGLPPLFVQSKGGTDLIPATRIGPTPDLSLWREMFNDTTVVQTRGLAEVPPQITASEASFVLANESLRALRVAAVEDRRIEASGRITGSASRALQIVRSIHAAEADPTVSLPEQMTRLRVAGDENAALAAPFAAYARALSRGSGRSTARAGRPLSGVRPITSADFHQVIGLLLTFPHLARAVGLRIDLTVPAFTGPRSIRIVGADGKPINGDKPVPQPFSRVVADPNRRRFVMQDGPGPAPEITAGMLAVAGNPDYVVSTVDVVGQSLQLAAQSTALASARAGEIIDPSLPSGRDLGITIARRNRPATVVAPRLTRSGSLHHDLISAAPTADSLELFGDDVTRGYRLDVARNGGPFRSLMTRRVATTVGSRVLPTVVDEGRIDAFTGVEQSDEQGVSRLTTGDELASWDGWTIAVPRPGFKVETEPGAPAYAAPAPPVTMPGYRVRTEISAVEGSVERLRFGDTLAFRARAVTLAGDSIDQAAIDPAQVLPPVTYLRTAPAASPTIVLRRRYSPGESLHHLVVRSRDGVALGEPCERHVAPPNIPMAQAERHGVFDAAYGNNRGNQGIRDEMFQVARREAGSFLDPVVPGPNGTQVPARGIAVVTNDPAAPSPVTLPVPRGQALPNGAYVIHDTDHPELPYLPDPIVQGASLIGFPGAPGPLVASYGGPGWPRLQPMRLIVRPTSRLHPAASAEVVDDGGRPAMLVHVPAGFTGTVELSSSIRADRLRELETLGAAAKTVTAGLLPELSPRQEITIVHAVPVPAQPPAIVGPVEPVSGADTPSYTAAVAVSCHRATTSQVDIEATWQEIDDPGVGDLVNSARTLRIGSATIERTGGTTDTINVKQLFGDTRHRRITLTPWAATRFREYFPPVPAGDRTMQRPAVAGVAVSIRNRSRPAPPVVHSIIPLFKWSRGIDQDGRLFSTRTPAGLRVYLHRRWQTTGEGELLGVVLHTTTPQAGDFDKLETLVSRWGGDPLEQQSGPAIRLVEGNFASGSFVAPAKAIPLPDARAKGVKALVLGHPVHFDADRDLWYADVRLSVTTEPWPFVRLGLVRYQPESLPGLEVSTVVDTDIAQLPPDRTVTFQREGSNGIRVKVTGKQTANSSFTVRQERWIPDPFDASTGLASDAGITGWQLTPGPLGAALRANLLLSHPTGPGTAVMTEIEAGRVVVEETMDGLSLLSATTAGRTVFAETVRRADIPGG